jgi:mediator of RNA polymerase II transcription subunit 12
MRFRDLPPRVLAQLAEAVTDVTRLNAVADADPDACALLDPELPTPALERKIERLLTWSVTPLQFGAHRAYAAATLLRAWLARAARRAPEAAARTLLQDRLFAFLDGADPGALGLGAVALLFGELVKRGLFSYELYVQRLIARGERGLSFADVRFLPPVPARGLTLFFFLFSHMQEQPSRHREFLRWIPLDRASAALVGQRRVLLHGVRARETPEEANERAMRAEIRPLFPEVFRGAFSFPLRLRFGVVRFLRCTVVRVLTCMRQTKTRRIRSLRTMKRPCCSPGVRA